MVHRTGRIVDRIHLRVADLEASRHFYRHALDALGLADTYAEGDGHFLADELYVDRADGAVSHVHLALQAASQAAVQRFHVAALAAGGRDNGAPGPGTDQPDDYAAFVLDPDGNNIEAVWHGPGPDGAAATAAGKPSAAADDLEPPAPRRADGTRRAATGAERRRAERKPFRGNAQLRFADAPPLAVRTFDLSTSGLGVVASVNLPSGLACTASLALPPKPGQYVAVELAATVIHSILAASEGGFKVGLQFSGLSPEAVQAIAGVLRG